MKARLTRPSHLKAHHAHFAFAPSSGRFDPAEVVDAHAFAPIATKAKFVLRALGTKVRMRHGVIEHAERRREVFISTGQAGGHRCGSDQAPAALRRSPIQQRGLDLRAAIDQHEELRCDEPNLRRIEGLLQLHRIGSDLLLRGLQARLDLLLEARRQRNLGRDASHVVCGDRAVQQRGLGNAGGDAQRHGQHESWQGTPALPGFAARPSTGNEHGFAAARRATG